MAIPIEKRFKYQLPQTERRKQLHERCSELSLILAQFIEDNVNDEYLKNLAIESLQNTNGLINQGITIDELNFLEECEKRNIGEMQIPVEKEDIWENDVTETRQPKVDLKSKIRNRLGRAK